MTPQERDLALLRRVEAGEDQALAELYDAYTPLLYPVTLRILRSASDAEDALQDAWLQVWKRAASYDSGRGTVAAWLLTVARTRALDRYRSLASRRRAESNVDPEPVTPAVDPSTSAAVSEIGARVREALVQLQPQQRRALEIAYFEGLSQSEIAERLGAPLGTVKSWMRQGLQKLKELIPHEEWV